MRTLLYAVAVTQFLDEELAGCKADMLVGERVADTQVHSVVSPTSSDILVEPAMQQHLLLPRL